MNYQRTTLTRAQQNELYHWLRTLVNAAPLHDRILIQLERVRDWLADYRRECEEYRERTGIPEPPPAPSALLKESWNDIHGKLSGYCSEFKEELSRDWLRFLNEIGSSVESLIWDQQLDDQEVELESGTLPIYELLEMTRRVTTTRGDVLRRYAQDHVTMLIEALESPLLLVSGKEARDPTPGLTLFPRERPHEQARRHLKERVGGFMLFVGEFRQFIRCDVASLASGVEASVLAFLDSGEPFEVESTPSAKKASIERVRQTVRRIHEAIWSGGVSLPSCPDPRSEGRARLIRGFRHLRNCLRESWNLTSLQVPGSNEVVQGLARTDNYKDEWQALHDRVSRALEEESRHLDHDERQEALSALADIEKPYAAMASGADDAPEAYTKILAALKRGEDAIAFGEEGVAELRYTVPEGTFDSDVVADLNNTYDEAVRNYGAGCFRSAIAMCGVVIETVVAERFRRVIGYDPSDTGPKREPLDREAFSRCPDSVRKDIEKWAKSGDRQGIGLGKMISYLTDAEGSTKANYSALDGQVSTINTYRCDAVHYRKRTSPTPDLAHGLIELTRDFLSKVCS